MRVRGWVGGLIGRLRKLSEVGTGGVALCVRSERRGAE